jgi:hypothetical protein
MEEDLLLERGLKRNEKYQCGSIGRIIGNKRETRRLFELSSDFMRKWRFADRPMRRASRAAQAIVHNWQGAGTCAAPRQSWPARSAAIQIVGWLISRDSPMAPMRSLPMGPGPHRIGSPVIGDGVRPDRGASAVYLTSHDFTSRKEPFSHGKRGVSTYSFRKKLSGAALRLKKSARFVWSLHSSLEYPGSSHEALPGSGCRPPRWRFSVRHWRDGRRGVPRRSARLWDRRWPLALGVRPLALSPRFLACALRHGSAVRRLAELSQRSAMAQCSMAAMSEDRRGSREGVPACNAPREPLNIYL